MTLIERVALVLFSDGEDGAEELWRLASGSTRDHYFRRARLVIEAVREPTEQQLFKMSRAEPAIDLSSIRRVYDAAIDAALTEPESASGKPAS